MILTYTILNVGDLFGSQLTHILTLFESEVLALAVAEFILIVTAIYVLLVIRRQTLPLKYKEQQQQQLEDDGSQNVGW